MRVETVVLLAALCWGAGVPQAAGPNALDTAPPTNTRGEAAMSAGDPSEAVPELGRVTAQKDVVADAIDAGMVRDGMTMEQVLQARGEPTRKEVIPPDLALWHYPDGEVAFSNGQVTYVSIGAVQPSAPVPAVTDTASRMEPRPVAPEHAAADTARVHTPGDGFLALRSEPSIRHGSRLDKIPHGSLLTLDECRASPQDGRWCRTRFRGQSGWVFDRYLVR